MSKALDFILFANGINIFFSHKDPDRLMRNVNSELEKLSRCLEANKLSINIEKSNFILFEMKQNKKKLNLHFSINNVHSNRVKEVLFLGVILDERLSWNPQIQNVARKISKSIDIIYKSSFCLNKASLSILYYGLLYPYLQYCVSVWGSTHHSNCNRLITLQNNLQECF